MRADIVVIGGGIAGSSIAYHLARDGRAGEVTVVEPDPSYEFATTPRGTGGIRQLFSLPENIEMSKYGLAFYKAFETAMAVDGLPAPIDWRQGGYLFLAEPSGAAQLQANWELQRSHGCNVRLLDAAGIRDLFPSLKTDDVALGVHSPDDGWIDPYAAVVGFAKKARSLGARYVQDRVVGFDADARKATAVRLASGGQIAAGAFVNAAGPWAREVADMLGMPLPVEPMSRLNHFFRCQGDIEPLPLVKEQSNLAFRPEGAGFIGGVPAWEAKAGFDWTVDHGFFERMVWPALARRCPAFEAVRHERDWVGHYSRNTLDKNTILGPWVGGLANVYVATGFSGHGIMHAPAVGRAMAELLLDGAFRTLDLTRLGFQRVVDNAPYGEKGIV